MTHDVPRPRTAEEILALSIGPAFGTEERMIDGVLRRCPVMQGTMAIYHGPDDIISCSDESGMWALGRYADGSWFRRRMLI